MSQLSYRSPLEFIVSDADGQTIGSVRRRAMRACWVPYKANDTRIGWRMFRKPEEAQTIVEASFNDAPPDLGEPTPQTSMRI